MNDAPPRGFALVLSIALVLALTLLAAGMLAIAAREGLVASTLERRVRARYAAEAAARRAAADWSTRAHLDIEPGEARTAEPSPVATSAAVTVERVDTLLFLLRAQAGVVAAAGDTARARAALLLQVVHPATVTDALAAGITAESAVVVESGRVELAEGCAAGAGESPAVVAPVVETWTGAVVAGDPPVRIGAPAPLPPDFPLAPPLARLLADQDLGGGEVRPQPRTRDGQCEAGPGNWGATTPGHPCESLLPLIRAAGPLTMTGGEARGILVVDGDLTLTDGARFEGLLRVRGRIRITDGARVRGAIRADSVRLSDAVVLYDPCLVRTVASAPALDAAFRPARGAWIPVF